MAERSRSEPKRAAADAARVRALAQAARRGKHPDPTEHERLLDAAGNGDRAAREALLRAHLDWVVGAAAERGERGLSQGDLFQEGALGLMEAISSFRSSGQADFEAYARSKVGEVMDRALSEEESCRRDAAGLVAAAEDYERAEVELRRDLGRPATTAELAARLEWSQDRTAQVGNMVDEARRRHDEEILAYLEVLEPPHPGSPGDEPAGPAPQVLPN